MATMICGVLASMCILLPACVSLIGGKATNNTVGLSRIVNMDITQFLSGFDVSAKVNAQDAPLIFTGTIVLVAVIAFFVNKKVKRSEKYVCSVFWPCYVEVIALEIWNLYGPYLSGVHHIFSGLVLFSLL